MTWKDLVRDQMEKLEKERAKEVKKMDKIRKDDGAGNFSRKVEIAARKNDDLTWESGRSR